MVTVGVTEWSLLLYLYEEKKLSCSSPIVMHFLQDFIDILMMPFIRFRVTFFNNEVSLLSNLLKTVGAGITSGKGKSQHR
jgi:hypothetical protein